MTVERIKNLDIKNKGVFTGIYGLSATDEIYIEGNLCKYNLWKELYRYLHEEGYVTIFYNVEHNFFSYQLRDLELFLGKVQDDSSALETNSQTIDTPIRHLRRGGPLGLISSPRPQTDSFNTQSQSSISEASTPYADIIPTEIKEVGRFYRTKRTENRIFNMIFNFVETHRETPGCSGLAVVFTTPEKTHIDNIDQVITGLGGRKTGEKITGMPLRLLALYDAQNAGQMLKLFKDDGMLFHDSYFKNMMFPSPNDEQSVAIDEEHLFCVERPGQDEIANMFNRRRIFEGQKNVFCQPMDAISSKLWRDFPMRDKSGKKVTEFNSGRVQQVQTLNEMLSMDKQALETTLLKLDTDGGKQRLDALLGIDSIKQKLDAYIREFRKFKNGNGGKFMPHIALTGNPGTGKTTVARLIGEILREEGLLSQGQFIEAGPGDLKGQYVGETPVKTAELCRRAKGGILFVDEAYELCREGANGTGPDYGKEAIAALLPFMTSQDTDFVIVFAGYTKAIEYFLKNGNEGLESRVPNRWNIDDYSPEVLYKICMNSLGHQETTENFNTDLKMLLNYKYSMRNRNWANARSAEEIAQKIRTNYSELGKTGPMDTDCIPEEYMRHIKDISPEEEAKIFHDLDQLIGLKAVKESLRDLVYDIKGFRQDMREANGEAPNETLNLNYVFAGNPGTGKTTVAKKLGNIFYQFGILESPVPVRAKAGDIVKGDPAQNIKDFCDKATGKVLFIDEAYQLINNGDRRAVDALTEIYDDVKGKMAIVLAGYSSKMKDFLAANEGLPSRFPNQIHFEDYTSEELWQVLKLQASQFKLELHEDCLRYAIFYFNRKKEQVREGFANAREAENLLRTLKQRMRKRQIIQNLRGNVILPEDFESFGKIDPTLVKVGGSDTRSPIEKLDSLQGIDNIKSQFQKYINLFRYYNNHPQKEDGFLPHMVFMGNPGTGKTTVARIFGEILQEEGLLSTGNFIEVNAKKLIEDHVGGTEKKTRNLCQQAHGGIMFIDETYMLYKGYDGHNFGQEAIDVILTELTRKETIFIFAGYANRMNEFLDKANDGLRSRMKHIFTFEDYKPDVLTKILRSKLVGMETTPEFDRLLPLMVDNIYKRRNPKNFGNARDMKGVADDIISEYLDRHNSQGPLDVDCLPERYIRTLHEITPEEELQLMSEIEGLVGLSSVKQTLSKLTKSVKGMRKQIERGLMKNTQSPNLSFLFMGNPGTGKTTVAKLLGKILCGYGLLSSDEVNTYTKGQLMDKYVGGAEQKVADMFNESYGKVLFIDEAYELAEDEQGRKVLNQIMYNMWDDVYRGKMAIVMAGYTKGIMNLMNVNAGMDSRIGYKLIFEDYSNEELWQILLSNLHKENWIINEAECRVYADEFFNSERRNKGTNFGNARTCSQLKAALIEHQTCRVADMDDLDDTSLLTILPEDFPNFEEVTMTQIANVAQQLTGDVSVMSHTSNELFIDCASNDPSKLAKERKDLKYAVGLLHCSSMGEGTGFIVSLRQRYILTCSHVIENGSSFEFRMLSGKFVTNAHVLWNNYEQDMALLVVDELPAEARFLELDNAIDKDPQIDLTKLILCGFPDGSAFPSGVSLLEGAINNYEKQHPWNDRCFDTIYANVSATHGCSGGPVVRAEDLMVVGLLQGGIEGREIQLITDIHQLFRNVTVKS